MVKFFTVFCCNGIVIVIEYCYRIDVLVFFLYLWSSGEVFLCDNIVLYYFFSIGICFLKIGVLRNIR